MLDWLKEIDELHQIVGNLAVLIVCLAAFIWGSIRERLVAGVALFDVVTIVAFDVYLDKWWITAIAIKAGLLLVVYAGMSWRWPHAWLIVMTSLQCMDVLLVISAMLDGSILIRVNALLRNVVGWLMLLSLLLATVQTMRARLLDQEDHNRRTNRQAGLDP